MLLSDLGHSMYINILGQYTLSAFFSVLQNWFKLVYGQGRAGQGRAGQGILNFSPKPAWKDSNVPLLMSS